ncbi:hypothetical protein FOB64_000534 [Candida albicans]|uniref:DUF155 domain-containing protein n=1 Tax=Candida albicans TaxID=5476 RepID=A0A8H6C5W5_CANAX|nr:hypothetical protein FOB64_000534 [Candida albicans]
MLERSEIYETTTFLSVQFIVNYNHNYNFFPPSVSVTNIKRATKNIPKKKIGAQKLRRTDDSKFQHESASYILSLLNANRQETPSPKELEKYLSIVTSVTVGDSIDFDKLLTQIKGYEYQIVIPEEVINISTSTTNLMILSNGTLVGWNLTEEEIVQFLPYYKMIVLKISLMLLKVKKLIG